MNLLFPSSIDNKDQLALIQIRTNVWDTIYGKHRPGRCIACRCEIFIDTFCCGFYISKNKGGSCDTKNIVPLCRECYDKLNGRGIIEVAPHVTVQNYLTDMNNDKFKQIQTNPNQQFMQNLVQNPSGQPIQYPFNWSPGSSDRSAFAQNTPQNPFQTTNSWWSSNPSFIGSNYYPVSSTSWTQSYTESGSHPTHMHNDPMDLSL